MAWRVKKWESGAEVAQWDVSGRLGEQQICILLQRLVAKSLTEREVVEATESQSSLFERVGGGSPIVFGTDPYFTAERA